MSVFNRLFSGLLVAASIAIPTAHAADPIPVRVGFIPVIGSSQIFVADKEGWAKADGLELKLTQFESGPNMIAALASGTLDVYVAGVSPLAVARSKGIDVKVVAATAIEEMTVASSEKLSPYFAGGVKPAEAFKAFRAKEGRPAKIATQPAGSVPNTTLQHWLWEVTKTAKEDVEIISMGIDATQQALLAGAVEAATIREPADTILTQRNPKIQIIALGGDMFPNQPGGVIGVSGAFIAAYPEAVQALVNSIVKATDLIKKDTARVAPHIEASLGKGIIDTKTIEKALQSPASKFVSDPRLIIDATAKLQAYQVSIKTLEKDIPLDGLFDASYYIKATGGK